MTVAKAKVIAKSRYEDDSLANIVTFELEYPRIILAEFNTHRMISKNSSSSRAIPATNVIEHLENSMFIPEYWGENQSGMKARKELDKEAATIAYDIWLECGRNLIEVTKKLQSIQLHKQLTSRVSEAFQNMKTVATATERENLYWLRNHGDAQPEFQDLGFAMQFADQNTFGKVLKFGDWHLPYYNDGVWSDNGSGVDEFGYTLDQALKISTSICAQVSYRKSDGSLEKAENLWKMFFETTHVHASVSEHQSTQMYLPKLVPIETDPFYGMFKGLNEGATHIDKNGDVWSGNFKHWIQHRQLIPNHVKAG